VSVGPLPEEEMTIDFPADQRYSDDPVEPQAAATSGGADTAARILAGVALLIGGAGLGVAAASLRRGRAGA
jgi:hypothetical protein